MQNLSLLLLKVLSGIIRYSKFVPQDLRAYVLYIIQCRPTQNKRGEGAAIFTTIVHKLLQ